MINRVSNDQHPNVNKVYIKKMCISPILIQKSNIISFNKTRSAQIKFPIWRKSHLVAQQLYHHRRWLFPLFLYKIVFLFCYFSCRIWMVNRLPDWTRTTNREQCPSHRWSNRFLQSTSIRVCKITSRPTTISGRTMASPWLQQVN